jgi:hypothetical protein
MDHLPVHYSQRKIWDFRNSAHKDFSLMTQMTVTL